MRRFSPWIAVWGLAAAMAAVTTAQSLGRYREFRSGWAWDLAYNNQWFWALVYGDRTLSVRPVNFWGDEGPSIWRRTHLDPIRLPCVPVYVLAPGPEVLIAIHNAILWCLVPAAFGLARSETGSTARALMAAALVPLTPLLWPLAWNDYREMELALPFIPWAIRGWRERRRGLAAFGIVGLLLCREEYAVLVASLAILPARRPEDVGTTYRWSRAAFALGVGWVLFVYLGFQYLAIGRYAPRGYVRHFGGPKPGIVPTSMVALELLALGLGPWAALAAAAPRVAILALPWLVGLARGRWAMNLLGTDRWHHVRYASPIVGLVVAAGTIGLARASGWAVRARRGRWLVAGLWVATAAGLMAGRAATLARLDGAPRPIGRDEAEEVWRWIGRVGPDDGVLAHYEMTAPLSSRRHLYSYVMDQNRPRGYPDLGPEVRWVFSFEGDLKDLDLGAQGFEAVHRGDAVRIDRRP